MIGKIKKAMNKLNVEQMYKGGYLSIKDLEKRFRKGKLKKSTKSNFDYLVNFCKAGLEHSKQNEQKDYEKMFSECVGALEVIGSEWGQSYSIDVDNAFKVLKVHFKVTWKEMEEKYGED